MNPKTFSINILLIFTILSHNSLSHDPKYESCEPTSCGQGPKISYPFWLPGDQESFCGHPSFEISCTHQHPLLKISINGEYIIKDIFYSNHTFLVSARASYEYTCPTPSHNISLDQTPFSIIPSYVNFSLLYNCSSMPPYHTYPIDCDGNSSGYNYSFGIFHLEGLKGSESSLNSCSYIVNAPVDIGGDVGSVVRKNYSEVLKMGFYLNWTAPDCSACLSSGGRCGFENDEFVCFCPDGSQPKQSCHAGKNPNVGLKVGIGVSAAFVGGTFVGVLAFLLYRRHKKKYNAPSSLISRSLTLNYSSKADMEKAQSNYFGVTVFSYEELEEATNNFASENELGDGGFGTVYYGKLRDKRVVAVKRLYENNYKRVEQFLNEVEILTRLRHPNLVSLYGCTSRHSRELLLVYEYIPNGTVADHLHGEKSTPGLPWEIRMKIAVETAIALSYLHASEIIHRDVKTNNILLDDSFVVKVADFGLSRLFPLDVTHVSTAPQGTPGYVDPEYHECYQLTVKSDVYSFGVVLIELISSLPAVDITRHRHEINLSNMAINKIQSRALHELVDKGLGYESDYKTRKMINAVAELAFQCLQGAKEMRPSMAEVLETLKEIQNTDFDIDKAEEMAGLSADDVGLLKSKPFMLSPDTVTFQWKSTTTTPNASG